MTTGLPGICTIYSPTRITTTNTVMVAMNMTSENGTVFFGEIKTGYYTLHVEQESFVSWKTTTLVTANGYKSHLM